MTIAIALMILALLSLVGISLMSVSLTESQIGSNEADLKQALFAAEAGLQEAMYRLRLDPAGLPDEGDTPCAAAADPPVVGFIQAGKRAIPHPDPSNANFWKYNPPLCAWTYSNANAPTAGDGNYFGGTNAGNLDTAGRTFSSTGGAHGPGGALTGANLSAGASYTVTVAPVVGFVNGCWQYVDQFGAPIESCAKMATTPLFKVTSTGQVRSARKILSTMIRRFDFKPRLDGALTANTNVNVQSAAAVIDGRNHDCDGNNPSDEGSVKAATSPAGEAGIDINKPENLVCTAGTGTVCKGTSHAFEETVGALLLGLSPPYTAAQQAQIDALNAYLESIKIPPAQAPSAAFKGLLYIDGDYQRPPDGSEGILIVHHRNPYGVSGCTNPAGCDVATLGNFNVGTFKGLIVADKINKINGNAQIIGGVFGFGSSADGVLVDDVTGTPRIKYSTCILDQLETIANVPFRIVPGTWHEQ